MGATQLETLKRLGSSLNHAPFVCASAVDPVLRSHTAKSVTIGYQSHSPDRFVELAFPPQDPSDLEKLVTACMPATFGRGEHEVLDPTYRQAVRLDQSQFMTSLNLAEFPSLPEVQRVIGGQYAGIRAAFHKLNVYSSHKLNMYSSGGFFKAHRDTPRNTTCVGTQVVCLPTLFTGGEFVVKSGDGSFAHTFDWGASLAHGKVQ